MAIVFIGKAQPAGRALTCEPGRILVVDDDHASQMLATVILELEGYHVDVAASSIQAARLIAEHRPDLILMDVQLPGEDGLSFTRRLRADPLTASIPIVAVTALAMKGDLERTIAAGCDAYVVKPLDTKTFASDLRKLLRIAV
ncbi:MAG TPA: response regulator [Candidatus Dormibacteraeota bacterium]|nr:response regulator [Candidatus Dormibacteraeota bacterium]